jgi:hypothetical protein
LKDAARVAEATFRCAIPAGEATATIKFLRPVVEPRSGAKIKKEPAVESDVAAALPPWYVEVKGLAEVEKEKADNEVAEAKRLAKVVAAKAAADADAQKADHMGGASVSSDVYGGAAASNVDSTVLGEDAAPQVPVTVAVALGPSGATCANPEGGAPADDATEASLPGGTAHVLKVGDTVEANTPRKSEYHGCKAKLMRSLTAHWWVEFLDGPCKSVKQVKLSKDQVFAVESNAAPLSASIDETPNAQPPMDGKAALADNEKTVEVDGSKGGVDWQTIVHSAW